VSLLYLFHNTLPELLPEPKLQLRLRVALRIEIPAFVYPVARINFRTHISPEPIRTRARQTAAVPSTIVYPACGEKGSGNTTRQILSLDPESESDLCTRHLYSKKVHCLTKHDFTL